MEDRDLIDLDARLDKPPCVEVVVVPDSPAGLWGDPDPVPAPAPVAPPATLTPGKPTASLAPVAAPLRRLVRKPTGTTASWAAAFAGVGVLAGGLYFTLSWAAEAFSAVGRWFSGSGPWLVLGALLVVGTLAARYAPVRSGFVQRWGARPPGGFAAPAGGRGSLAVVGGAAVAGVRRVLHGNRGAAAEQASAGVWPDAPSSAGHGVHSPGGGVSGVRRFGADGVEISHSVGAYGAAAQYGAMTYPGQSAQGFGAPGHVDSATGLYMIHGTASDHPHAAGQQWADGAMDYSTGVHPGAGQWSPAPAKPPREMTRPAALATWLFGPAEGPTAYSAPGVFSRNRWAAQSPGTGASALDPGVDRTFAAWLFDEAAPWMQGDGRPVRGERMSIGDMTLTHRWCERMREASSREVVHGQWSSGQGAILGFGAPCRFCAVGFLFDESDPNGWSSDGSVFSHSDAQKLFARYGRDFLMVVSNIFEGGAPLSEVADFVEANAA